MPPSVLCRNRFLERPFVPAGSIFFTHLAHIYKHPTFACTYTAGLPDAASIEASKMVDADNDRTVLIDASTAFRVNDEWTYGFPGEYNVNFAWICSLS